MPSDVRRAPRLPSPESMIAKTSWPRRAISPQMSANHGECVAKGTICATRSMRFAQLSGSVLPRGTERAPGAERDGQQTERRGERAGDRFREAVMAAGAIGKSREQRFDI